MYPAAPGLSPSDRPPPFALLRSFTVAFCGPKGTYLESVAGAEGEGAAQHIGSEDIGRIQ